MPADVIVVTWNGARYLPRCLDALAKQTTRVRVIGVDNSRTDGSAEYVRTHHPEVELIALSENRGYAGGANAGIRAASGAYVMVMNPDVVLAADHLAVLAERLGADRSVGAAQGKLFQVAPAAYEARSRGHQVSVVRIARLSRTPAGATKFIDQWLSNLPPASTGTGAAISGAASRRSSGRWSAVPLLS